jgi:DNA-binding NarL/FixJ family response regulator
VVVEEASSVLSGPIDALTERLAAIGIAILAPGIVALVTSLLSKLPDFASTTVVMFTAKAQTSDVGDAEGAGADGYFSRRSP